MNTINTFDFLRNSNLVHIKVNNSFKQYLKSQIINKHGSLRKYNNKILKIPYSTLKSEFKENRYLNFCRLLKIIQDIDLQYEELDSEIKAFFAYGSKTCRELILNKELLIDEFFVEGYALYLAEGDNGYNGNKIPRKFRFTNADVNVINHMIKWITTYFPNNNFYVNVINPKGCNINFEEIKILVSHDKLNLKQENYNKIIKYKICFGSAILIDLILSIENTIKDICGKDAKLAAAYIRGMMIGEGTAYFNRSRYVRIEMRNEKEIKYLHILLTILGFNCKPVLRNNRHNMWSLYIGAKQLDKFAKEIGFGIHEKRQKILEKGVNKVLRVNQYC